jgi:hypothetical protein
MLNLIKKEMIRRKSFTNIDEAVLYCIDLMNKQARNLQDIFNDLQESNCKERLILMKVSALICDKLEVYGMKISYEDLEKQARAGINRDWPRVKKEVAEILEARDKEIDDLLKDVT